MLAKTGRGRTIVVAGSWIALGAALLWARLVFAETSSKPASSVQMDHFLMVKRAEMIRPLRKDGPLRYVNISDDEVREIQGAASEVVGKVWVYIGGVTHGCPCEDGARCTDQVWVQAEVIGKPFGMLLSQIDEHWVIGPVQRWWWRYEKAERLDRDKLVDELSHCGIEEAKQEILRQYHAGHG